MQTKSLLSMHNGDQPSDFFSCIYYYMFQISRDTVDLYEDLDKTDDLEDFGDDDDE